MLPVVIRRLVRVFCAIGPVALLAACAGSATPQLIGAYRPGDAPPIATYVPPSGQSLLVYDGYLSLRVRDVPAAAAAAADLAYSLGGYLAGQQTWHEGRDQHVTLTLAVPAPQFDLLRTAVSDLGRVQDERLLSDPVPLPPGGSAWNTFAHLTVHLAPPATPQWRLPRLPGFGWSPAHTFSSAFTVFAAVFTFLLDVLIWLSVVVGPFILLGLGLRWLLRQARRPAPPTDPH
jgi:hypothetical protein